MSPLGRTGCKGWSGSIVFTEWFMDVISQSRVDGRLVGTVGALRLSCTHIGYGTFFFNQFLMSAEENSRDKFVGT